YGVRGHRRRADQEPATRGSRSAPPASGGGVAGRVLLVGTCRRAARAAPVDRRGPLVGLPRSGPVPWAAIGAEAADSVPPDTDRFTVQIRRVHDLPVAAGHIVDHR